MTGYLLMSPKERKRKVIIADVCQGYLTLQEAAERMQVSYRQAKRIYKRYRESGDKGLLHARRGCASNRTYSEAFKTAVIAEYQAHYEGFGPTLAAEKLVETGYRLHHDTLRRWLVGAGLWQKKRKRSPYRQRRERRACFGELLQLDGSHHAWFGEGTKRLCLMNLVDDASGISLTLLAEQETTEAAMRVLQEWITRYGIPKEIYVDLKSVYISPQELKPTAGEEKVFTVFGEACRKLNIVLTKAYSPQAKGRVERKHAVYQDRLVKEIGLKKLTTIAQVNHLLREKFDDALNARFAKAPTSTADAHRPLTAEYYLPTIFCWETTRQLMNDWTLQYQGQFYQVEKTNNPRIQPKRQVHIRQHLDKSLSFTYKGLPLLVTQLEQKPIKPDLKKKPLLTSKQRAAISKKNSASSYWRTFNPDSLIPKHNKGDISISSN